LRSNQSSVGRCHGAADQGFGRWPLCPVSAGSSTNYEVDVGGQPADGQCAAPSTLVCPHVHYAWAPCVRPEYILCRCQAVTGAPGAGSAGTSTHRWERAFRIDSGSTRETPHGEPRLTCRRTDHRDVHDHPVGHCCERFSNPTLDDWYTARNLDATLEGTSSAVSRES